MGHDHDHSHSGNKKRCSFHLSRINGKGYGEISLRIKKQLEQKGIYHVTIQMESEEYAQFNKHEH